MANITLDDPLLMLLEADDDEDPAEKEADPVGAEPSEEPAPDEEDPTLGGEEGDDQAADPEPDASAADGGMDEEDDEGGGQSDPVGDQIRRERLYDAIVDIQQQCEQLSASAEIIIDRVADSTAKTFAVRSKKLLDDTISQCDIIRSRFADLGYERVRDLYATARERVSAVTEIIKHVIDGDDDFRKTDSGTPQRNGSAAKQGRGRSE